MRILARVLESEEVVRKKCLKHGIKVTTTQTPFAVHSFCIYVPLWEWSKLIKFGWSTLPLFFMEWLECKMRPILYRMRSNCQISILSFQNYGFAIWCTYSVVNSIIIQKYIGSLATCWSFAWRESLLWKYMLQKSLIDPLHFKDLVNISVFLIFWTDLILFLYTQWSQDHI